MLKKISVVALLLSFLLAFGVPVQTKADVEMKVIPAGNYIFNDTLICFDMLSEYDNWVLPYLTFTYWNEPDRALNFVHGINAYVTIAEMKKVNVNNYHQAPSSASSCYSNGEWGGEGYKSIVLQQDFLCESVFYEWFKLNVQDPDGLLIDLYTFEEWCADAGVNCSASSNESDSVVPFFYSPDYYNYIVRKTLTASSTSGVYQVTVLQKGDGAHYPYYFEVNDIGYLGIAGVFSDVSTFTVRNYYYDADGKGWKKIERFDVSTLPFDNTNVTFYENVVFIYSDTDIYADREASSIWQAASTEYYNVDIPEPEAPTPTPTPVPSSGEGRPGAGTRPDTGGEATGGGGLDFIINLFTLIWQKICSIPMAVDGYSISLQQIFVYGALVSIVGGFIVKFIFRR